MKFINFRKLNEEKVGILFENDSLVIDLSTVELSKKFADMNDLINNISSNDIEKIKNILDEKNCCDYVSYPVNDVKICAPIKKPIHDIICVGVNYKEHLEETKREFDKESFKNPNGTVYFSKRVVEAIGPEDIINSHYDIDKNLDYEVELAVVIGAKGTNITKEEAEDYIFGYTILNDISARGLQKHHVQWYRGKSLDGFTSIGPVIVHKSQIPFPVELNISSRINGETRQNSNTKYFLKDIPSIIAEISNGITLEPGDIIATGTPSGVGMGFNPPKYMQSGDLVECEVENIGVLRNVVK